jgi:hypothetical protein
MSTVLLKLGGVCGSSLGEPLRQQETFQTSLYIQANV